MSTDSPFSSHAATRRKLLRRSATVAVLEFMREKTLTKDPIVKLGRHPDFRGPAQGN
jgi:hypothetical protein